MFDYTIETDKSISEAIAALEEELKEGAIWSLIYI